jgi:hypothetical protein
MTECHPEQLEFHGLGKRAVVAAREANGTGIYGVGGGARASRSVPIPILVAPPSSTALCGQADQGARLIM